MPLQHSHEHEEQPLFLRMGTPQENLSEAVHQRQDVLAGQTGQRSKATVWKVARPSLNQLTSRPLWYLLAMSMTLPWVFINDPTSKWFYLYLPLALAFGTGFAKKRSGDLYGLWFGIAGLLAMLANGMVHHWAAPRMDVFLVMLTLWLGGGSLTGMVGGMARHGVEKAKEEDKAQNVPPAG